MAASPAATDSGRAPGRTTPTGDATATSAGDSTPSTSGGDVERAHSGAAQNRLTERERRAAEIAAAGGPDQFPPYDMMTLDELRATAAELDVAIPPDVEKALLITELRAHRSGTLSVARKRSA